MSLFGWKQKEIEDALVEELVGGIKTSGEGDSRIDQSLAYLEKCLSRYHHDMAVLKKYYVRGRILEIGSYPYHFTYFLKKSGYEVVGLDLEPTRFTALQNQNGLEIKKVNIEKDRFCFEDGFFDFIIFNEVFEHLKEPIHALSEINRVLKPGGLLLISTPNVYFLPHLVHFLSGRGAIADPFTAFSKPYWLGHMGHVREYSNQEVQRFLENLGFKAEKSRYVQNRLFLSFKRNKYMNRREEIGIPSWLLFPLNLANLLVVSILPFLRENIVIIASKKKDVDNIFKVNN